MSLSIGSTNNINPYPSTTTNTNVTSTNTSATSATYNSDSVSFSTASTPTALPDKASGWKKFSNSMGEFFSNIADKLKFGETYKLASQEFQQVDMNKNNALDRNEFNVATLNLFDFWGTEFAKADKNRDSSVDVKEYADYRKMQLSNMFDSKDANADKHLSVNEIGFIGQQMLKNQDPRLDENQDGLVNKREFTRSALRGAMNIRDFLGF